MRGALIGTSSRQKVSDVRVAPFHSKSSSLQHEDVMSCVDGAAETSTAKGAAAAASRRGVLSYQSGNLRPRLLIILPEVRVHLLGVDEECFARPLDLLHRPVLLCLELRHLLVQQPHLLLMMIVVSSEGEW